MPFYQQHPETFTNTQKKPQAATNFWGDAIVIFTQANFYDVSGGSLFLLR
jgi:hypothetical protein